MTQRCVRGSRRARWARTAAYVASMVYAVLLASQAEAVVFHARDEALEMAFPTAERVEPRTFFLTAAQRTAIETHARAPLSSDMLTVYIGYVGEHVVGYAVFDTHVVRTLPETFLVVLSPEGGVDATYLLAFHEPVEYAPSDTWLKQFIGKERPEQSRLGRTVAGITGATLTADAVTKGVRRVFAIYTVLLRDL